MTRVKLRAAPLPRPVSPFPGELLSSYLGRLSHANTTNGCATRTPSRTFGETRRRVKVIGRLPGERTCLGLVWAVLDRASRGWRGVTMTPATVRQLQQLRLQLLHPEPDKDVTATVAETITTAAY